jgi:hypothetical protein
MGFTRPCHDPEGRRILLSQVETINEHTTSKREQRPIYLELEHTYFPGRKHQPQQPQRPLQQPHNNNEISAAMLLKQVHLLHGSIL